MLFKSLIFNEFITFFYESVNGFFKRCFVFIFHGARWRVAAAVSIDQKIFAICKKPVFFFHRRQDNRKEETRKAFLFFFIA